MNILFKRFLSMMLAVIIMSTFLTWTTFAAPGDLSLNLSWLNVPADQKQNLSWSDPTNLNNPTQIIKYGLDIHSTQTSYEKGKLVIRIKQPLWTDRNGKAIKPDSIGIPQAPAAGGSEIPFNYTVDPVTNELVITNTAPTEEASNYTIQVQYKVTPWDTVDGSISSFTASATGTDSAGNINTSKSPTITYKMDTDFRINSLSKQDPRFMYFWDPYYTNGKPKPADFDNYRWVSWLVKINGKANQPFSVTLKDIPLPGGEVYGVSSVADAYPWNNLNPADFTVQPDGTIISKTYTNINEATLSNGSDRYMRVLVRYPKTIDNTLNNTITASMTGTDDKTSKIATANATTSWKDYNFTYTGAESSMIKYSGDWDSNLRQLASKLSLLRKGIDTSFTWGMRTTMDLYPGVNYTGATYSGELVDDFANWELVNSANTPATNYNKMSPDDYEYTMATFNGQTYKIDRSNGQKVFYTKGDKSAPLVKVWALVKGSNDFQLVSQFYASEVSYSNGSGGETNAAKIVSLPVGTYQTKVTYENAVDHLMLKEDLSVKLKANSPQLKAWFTDSANDDKRLRVQNFDYYKIFNQDGSLRNPGTQAGYKFTSDQGNNSTIAANDQSTYGQYLQRSSAGLILTNLSGSSSVSKYASTPVNDTINHLVDMKYWLHGDDTYDNLTNDEYNQLVKAGWPPPSRDEAVFYDLLPLGMFYNEKKPPTVYDINGKADTSNMTVNTIENYKGTGRQLVIFKIAAKTPGQNYSKTGEVSTIATSNEEPFLGKFSFQPLSKSGYTVVFNASVPWDNIPYAKDGTNLSAYQVPEDDPLHGGGNSDDGNVYPLNTVLGNDGKPIFYDLRGNGVTPVRDTLYATVQKPINISVAAGSGLSKLVRADEDGELAGFNKTAQTKVKNGYTYQLKVGTDSNSTMKDVVLFDILEEAENTENHTGETSWKGTFNSIDLSYARYSGINSVVYYSTKPGLTYQSLTAASLSNGDWTTTEPSDKSKITAVAVDLRRATNGSEFVFKELSRTQVLINMKAPENLPNYQYTYNRSGYYSTLITSTGETATSTNVSARTAVKVYNDPLFVKSSSKIGGTSANDAVEVDPNQIITYNLSFDPGTLNSKAITVKDIVPAGMTLVPGSISFTPAGQAQAQLIDDSAYNSSTSQIVWPAYDQSVLGSAGFSFKVKVDPLESGANGVDYRFYENKANVTVNNNPPINSNVITHQQKNRWARITKSASLVEAETILPEDNGTIDSPVTTKLGQTVEYHIVVTNTGANQISGEIDVTDYIPQGTTYVANSATAVFQDGTGISQATSQIDDKDIGAIKWTLNKLSDGEKAYLTFRVKAPKTAFDPNDTTNLRSEKVFENAAYMVDVPKKETKTTVTTYHSVEEARISVQKIWDDSNNQDGLRPEDVLVQLYANNFPSGEPVRLSSENNWRYDWVGLESRNKIERTLIEYLVNEVSKSVENYIPSSLHDKDTLSPYVENIKNIRVPETTSKSVTKIWDDKDNQDGKRPNKIYIQLFSNDSAFGDPVELNAENSWKYTWDVLPKNASGKEIVYTVLEIGDTGQYQATYDYSTFTIKNSYTPQKTSRTAIKYWNDNNDQFKARPKSVEIQLYANGISYEEPAVLSDENMWRYTWNNIPLKKDGKIIHYTVKETEVPSGYEALYDDDLFIITNKYKYSPLPRDNTYFPRLPRDYPHFPRPHLPRSYLPFLRVGDSDKLLICIMLLSVSGLVFIGLVIRYTQKKKDKI